MRPLRVLGRTKRRIIKRRRKAKLNWKIWKIENERSRQLRGEWGMSKKGANLCAIAGNVIEDGPVSAITKATVLPFFGIILITIVKPLGAKVEGVTEGFVNGLKRVSAGHEHLENVSFVNTEPLHVECTHTLKGRRASSRVGGAKDRFVRHGGCRLVMIQCKV
jgi:hypothetical protein